MPFTARTLMLSAVVLFLMLFSPVASQAWKADLTDEELKMPEAKYYNPVFVDFPEDVVSALVQGPLEREDVLDFENTADLQQTGHGKADYGYRLLEDGTGYVAVKTDFPGASGDMIYWWFWWHGYKDIRYKIWCPGAHYAVKIKDLFRANNWLLPYRERIENNTIYSTENVGMGIQTLAIHFVPPEKFGFDPSQFKRQGIEAVLCVEVGLMIAGVNIPHSYMVHVWQKTPHGLELRSRFWLGKMLPYKWMRQLIFSEKTLKDMLFHCALEYNHLAGFLPDIYREFGRPLK
jgi:hypothetical protein